MPRLSTIRLAFLAAAACLSVVWLRASPATLAGSVAPPMFTETIAPILYANCVTCHRAGEAAPFPLISYEDVAKRATLVAEVTSTRYMPPWHAAHGYGEFAEERRLTDAQIAAIGEWVKAGMPRGDTSKLPAMPRFPEGWQLGTPDLVLEMPQSFEVSADGPDLYRNFVLPTGLGEDRWLRAIEFRPGARKAVHHAIFMYVRGGAVTNTGSDGKPGFKGAMPLTFGPKYQPSGELGGWAVGTTPRFARDGYALPLPKGSDLVLQMHFHPTGKVEMERSAVGLYFTDVPPERKIFGPAIPGLFGLVPGIDIPPGERNYTITGKLTVAVDARVLAVRAHAHYLGKEIKADATLPDGSTKPLLWIQDWDFNWQDRYDYKEPVFLPKGTQVDVSIRYDNSAENPRNPCSPPRRVRWGLQSFDEMGTVRFDMVAVRKEDEAVWQEFFVAAVKAGLQQVSQRAGAAKEYLDAQQRFQPEESQPTPCGVR